MGKQSSQLFRYIKNVMMLSIVVIAIPAIAANLISPNEENNLHVWKTKRLRFEALSSPRILFLGDSNVAFGLDSKTIGDSLHCNVQNAGLHGGIGMLYSLQEYDDLIKTDDLVVLCFTYDQFIKGYGEYLTLPVVIYHNDWHGLDKLIYPQWKVFLSGFMQIFKQNYLPFSSERSYRASYYNKYGDENRHWTFSSLSTIPQGVLPEGNINHDIITLMLQYIRKWEQKGAKVILMPACVPDTYLSTNKDRLYEIEKELAKRNQPYIIPIDSCVYDESYMYDGYYHMNKKGVDRFCKTIIKQLRKYKYES